jgi:hypothetical protein
MPKWPIQCETPLGFYVRITEERWDVITRIKHPAMRDRLDDIVATLRLPQQIRRSTKDPAVYLFYGGDRPGRWVCAVAKRVNSEGFLITAYPTDAIKEGEPLWPK